MKLSEKEETIRLGGITLHGDSPRLIVTDPCYVRGTWCQAIVEDCAPGRWLGRAFTDFFDMWGRRVHCLAIVLEDSAVGRLSRSRHPSIAGVDSGQLGVFDESLYPDGKPGEYGDLTTFYGRACDVTQENWAGALDEGFVSSSGFGDGAYPIYVTRREDGRAVAVEVVFIDDDEDDEDDEEVGA